MVAFLNSHLTVADSKMASRVGPTQLALTSRESPARVALAAGRDARSMVAVAAPEASVTTCK